MKSFKLKFPNTTGNWLLQLSGYREGVSTHKKMNSRHQTNYPSIPLALMQGASRVLTK